MVSLYKYYFYTFRTSLRCTRCGEIITGGCYNYPSGCLCIKCAENENK